MDQARYRQFEKIYDAYAKAIFRFVYFRVSERSLAEDISHDVFLQFWKSLSGGEEIKEPRALLYTIAHGLVVDHYRKKKYRIQVSLDAEKVDGEPALSTDVLENEAIAKEEFGNVLAKLKTIKQEYQDALLMYYVEGLDVSEMARILRKKENAVRVLIHRALKTLKNKL
ncbi:MAG TPA: RNA polymerase sigma factor [Candidatus Paceibacterota bacterium]|nr:RNA polymerase sigma factor [Candidatus Paceibacterota bacterium]